MCQSDFSAWSCTVRLSCEGTLHVCFMSSWLWIRLLPALSAAPWMLEGTGGTRLPVLLTGPSAELAELSVLEGAGLCCESQ